MKRIFSYDKHVSAMEAFVAAKLCSLNRLLKDNASNIMTHGFVGADELNKHFRSVFTRKYTSSLPIPET